MKQVGKYGLWVPEDTDPPDGPSQIEQLAEGTEGTEGLNDKLDRAGAQTGKSIIATQQTTTSGTFVLLGTPDRVQNIVLPTDGLIFILYQAISVGGSGRAAFFLNETQLKRGPDGVPAAQEARIGDQGGLASYYGGLAPAEALTISASSHVATGQVIGTYADNTDEFVGGPCCIFADAGEYDVEVRFREVSLGASGAKERKLWVWTRAFN